jgi:ABC-2 type transport system permease protein
LQAVVRERANHALEALLAAAQAWELVLGKLIGVGAVSILVLAAWLGSVVALAPLATKGGGGVAEVIAGMADPVAVMRTGFIYGLAFAFYGLVTIGLGALARDSAQAQNLSRPMFAVLLLGFFCAMTAATGGAGLSWLVYLPPFSPFLLLMQAPGQMAVWSQVLSLCGLAAATGVAGAWAVGRLSLSAGIGLPAWP